MNIESRGASDGSVPNLSKSYEYRRGLGENAQNLSEIYENRMIRAPPGGAQNLSKTYEKSNPSGPLRESPGPFEKNYENRMIRGP